MSNEDSEDKKTKKVLSLSPLNKTDSASKDVLIRKADTSKFWKQVENEISDVDVQMPALSNMANDNPTMPTQKSLGRRVASFALAVCAMGVVLTMNSSAVATNIVMSVDDQILVRAMETNPDAVAHLLNAMDVGVP